MRSFEIFVAPQLETPRFDPELAVPTVLSPEGDASARCEESRPRLSLAARPLPRSAAREALGVFVDGANLTSRFTERDATCVLRDLALALVQLARQERGKAIVHFNEDAWELAIERAGTRGWISVYRGGALPQITAYDRPVLFADVVASVREAAELARLRHPRDLDLREACAALATLDAADSSLVASVSKQRAHPRCPSGHRGRRAPLARLPVHRARGARGSRRRGRASRPPRAPLPRQDARVGARSGGRAGHRASLPLRRALPRPGGTRPRYRSSRGRGESPLRRRRRGDGHTLLGQRRGRPGGGAQLR